MSVKWVKSRVFKATPVAREYFVASGGNITEDMIAEYMNIMDII